MRICTFFVPHAHHQRLEKEVKHYQKEVQDNEAQWKGIESDPTKDAYDAKRFRDIWEESVRMVPDAERRYQAALQDLSAHVQQYFSQACTDGDNEWLVVARQILATTTSSNSQSTTEQDEKTAPGGVGGEATNVDNLAEGEAF